MKKEAVSICLLFVFIALLFFHPVLRGFLPFPGDLLVGEYAPYNSYPFLGYAPSGFPNKAQDFDVLRLLFPAKEFSINILKNFDLPFWNPYIFSGNPHLASLQSGSFYPFNIIFWLFSFNFAWFIYIFIQPVLTLFFTYILLREFSLNKKSSIFGSVVFAFSSYLTVWMEYGNIGHTILWLPLAMWLSLKYLKKPSLLISISLIFSLTFSIFAGYIQTTFYVYIFLFAFIMFNIFSKYRSEFIVKFTTFIPIFLLPILLSSIQLLPTIELLSNSARSPYSLASFIKLLIPQYHLATLFAPDFFGNPATRNYWLSGTYIERVSYIGVIPLFFALYAVIRKPTKLIGFFIVSAVIVYLITFDSVFSRILYSIFLPPFLSAAVPTRIMFIFCFCMSILAAYGFDSLQKDKSSKQFWISTLLIASVYVFLWIFVATAPLTLKDQSWIPNLKISLRNLFIPSTLFLLGVATAYLSLRLKHIRNFAFIILFLLTVFDLFYFFQKITPFAPYESIYPKTEVLDYLKKIQGINRSWGYGSGYIDANIQTHEKIFSTNGYDALHLRRYGELLTASYEGKIAASVPGANADIVPGYGEDDLKNNYYRKRILNLLGVKYVLNKTNIGAETILADNRTFPEKIYKLIWQNNPWQIYENIDALPRFYLADNYIVLHDKQKIIDTIFNKNFNLRKTLILEENISSEFNLKPDKNAKITLLSYTSNKAVFKTQSKEDALLFLSDNYYPGWQATVDGLGTNIYRANYSLRAVPVKKGNHEVVFSYYPKSFTLGLKISLITFSSIIIAASFIILRRSHV